VPSSLRTVCEAFWLATQPDGYPLLDWLADQRQDGTKWRHIANDLRERTGGVIDLPSQTLINWYSDAESDAA
jgi:hypothetical protein